jgi:hypothetical protein
VLAQFLRMPTRRSSPFSIPQQPLVRRELQRSGEEVKGRSPWRPARSTLEVTYTPDAQTSSISQCFLGQAGRESPSTEEISKVTMLVIDHRPITVFSSHRRSIQHSTTVTRPTPRSNACVAAWVARGPPTDP